MIFIYMDPIIKLLKYEDMYKGEDTHNILVNIKDRFRKQIFFNDMFYNKDIYNGIFIQNVRGIDDIVRRPDHSFDIELRLETLKHQKKIFGKTGVCVDTGVYIKCDTKEDYDDFIKTFLKGIPEERHCEYMFLVDGNKYDVL